MNTIPGRAWVEEGSHDPFAAREIPNNTWIADSINIGVSRSGNVITSSDTYGSTQPSKDCGVVKSITVVKPGNTRIWILVHVTGTAVYISLEVERICILPYLGTLNDFLSILLAPWRELVFNLGTSFLSSFLLLSATIVAIRVWRKIKEHKLAIEDILLIVAEFLLIALTATVWKLVVVSYAGYHAADIPVGAVNLEQVRLWRYINNAIYNQILGLVKISFLITLLKLRSMNRLIIASLWALIIVNICFVFAATFGSIFMCRPIHKYWQPEVPGHCANAAQYIFGVIGVTIGTDVLVALIPAWILYDLQMSLKNKVGVIVFLSLPLAVTAIGCYRLHRFIIFFSLPNAAAEDPYNVRNALSNVEANLGVIAVCGPTIKWILGRFIPYFDTARTTDAFTPDLSLHPRQRSRGYVKSNDGIELQSSAFENIYPQYSRNSCWKADSDADSEKQCITVETGKEAHNIRKTTVVEWERMPSS